MCLGDSRGNDPFGAGSLHWFLYAASLFLALFSSLEQPARTAIIPNLVPRDDLTNALALSGTQRHVATIVGPSLAGLLLARSGATALLRGRRDIVARDARRACDDAAPLSGGRRARRCFDASSARRGAASSGRTRLFCR